MKQFILRATTEDGEKVCRPFEAEDTKQAEEAARRLAGEVSGRVVDLSFDEVAESHKIDIPKPITERVKTFADACREVGTTEEAFNESCKAAGLTPDEVAYRKIKVIVTALNEGWEPDFLDENEYKYIPWFRVSRRAVCVGGSASNGAYAGLVYVGTSDGSSLTPASRGARLCYKSRELAVYAGNQFIEIYHNYLLNDALALPTQE